ncbi:MAG: thioredoxin domain-containing protein [Nitrospira sp.]
MYAVHEVYDWSMGLSSRHSWLSLVVCSGIRRRFRRDRYPGEGQANAPVTLIEYSDFTCGFCLKFFKRTWPRIQERYVDTGKVRFMYRDFPRGDQGVGLDAATAARCAGAQGQYWGMHDRLFSEGGQLDKHVYRRHAMTLRLDQAAFERCMSDGRYTKAIFEDRQEANQWGFHGTPGFILVRTATEPTEKEPAVAIPGAFPFEMFAEEIDRLLASGTK